MDFNKADINNIGGLKRFDTAYIRKPVVFSANLKYKNDSAEFSTKAAKKAPLTFTGRLLNFLKSNESSNTAIFKQSYNQEPSKTKEEEFVEGIVKGLTNGYEYKNANEYSPAQKNVVRIYVENRLLDLYRDKERTYSSIHGEMYSGKLKTLSDEQCKTAESLLKKGESLYFSLQFLRERTPEFQEKVLQQMEQGMRLSCAINEVEDQIAFNKKSPEFQAKTLEYVKKGHSLGVAMYKVSKEISAQKEKQTKIINNVPQSQKTYEKEEIKYANPKDIKTCYDNLTKIIMSSFPTKSGGSYMMNDVSTRALLDDISNIVSESDADFSKYDYNTIFKTYISDAKNLLKNGKLSDCYARTIDMYERTFDEILDIMDKNPKTSKEKSAVYFDKIRTIYDENQAQKKKSLDIKLDLLPFDKNDTSYNKEEQVELSEDEKRNLIDKINHDSSFTADITYESSMEDIADSWRRSYMGENAPYYTEKEAQACLQNLEKYTTETKTPLTRWMSMDSSDIKKYISSIPDEGEEFAFDRKQSFSKNSHKAETIYNDENPDMGVKVIVYPKGKISQSYDMKYGRYGDQETVFPKGSKFKVVHKGWEEYNGNERSGQSFSRYYVYLQEK